MQFPMTLAVARGTAIVLVLLFHSQVFLFDNGLAYAPYWKVVNFLTFILMPLLFLLSGLSMPFLVASRSAVYLYLYLLWTVVLFAFDLLFKSDPAELGWSTAFDLVTHLLIPQSILWFLYALLIYILVARIIARMTVAHQLAISILMAGLVELVDVHFAAKEIIQNFFFFLVGLHFRSQLTQLFSRKARVGFPVCGALYCLIYALMRSAGIERAPLLNEILGLLGVATTLFACRLVALTPLRHAFRPVGRNALQIYLLHLIFFQATWALLSSTIVFKSDLVGILGPFVLTGLGLIGSIAISRLLRNVPGVFGAPERALRILTPPLDRLVEAASIHGHKSIRSSTTNAGSKYSRWRGTARP